MCHFEIFILEHYLQACSQPSEGSLSEFLIIMFFADFCANNKICHIPNDATKLDVRRVSFSILGHKAVKFI
jgi:hypothetical protein